MSWLFNVFKSNPGASSHGRQAASTAFRRSRVVQRQPGEGRVIGGGKANTSNAATSLPIRPLKRPYEDITGVTQTRKRPKRVEDQSTKGSPDDQEEHKPSRKRQRSPADDESSIPVKRVQKEPIAGDDDVARDTASSLGEEDSGQSATIECDRDAHSTFQEDSSRPSTNDIPNKEADESTPEHQDGGDTGLATLDNNRRGYATTSSNPGRSLEERLKKIKHCLMRTASGQTATTVEFDLDAASSDLPSADVVRIGQWPGSHLVPGQKDIDHAELDTIEPPKRRIKRLQKNQTVEISIRAPIDRKVIHKVHMPPLFEPQQSVPCRSKKEIMPNLVAKVPPGHATQSKLNGIWNRSVGRPVAYLRR